LPIAKLGRIWLTEEDFFASSPSANLAGDKRRRTQVSKKEVVAVCFTTSFVVLQGVLI
jgi:hypothetical protein